MAITVTDADTYFNENVLHNSEWTSATAATKQRALNNARNQVYRLYTSYRETEKTVVSLAGYPTTIPARPAPDAAIFEQALWLMRLDETLLKAPAGLTMVSVSGIAIQVANVGRYICPESQMLLGRRIGGYRPEPRLPYNGYDGRRY